MPEDRARVQAAFAALTGDVPSLDIEYRILRPDQTIRWVRVRGFQVRDAANKLIRHTGIVTDITDRKKAGQKFQQLLESAPDAMILVNQAGLIMLVNGQTEKLFGWRREALLGQKMDVLLPERLRGRRPAHDLDLFAHPSSRADVELCGLRQDGAEFPFELSVSPIETEDGPMEISVIRDLTNRKRLEARLFQSQKMETVGKLAGGIAHEFNSILTAIIGQSELLLADLPFGSSAAESATEISQAATRAAALTRQLLAYGRKQMLQPESLDLNRIIASMHGAIQHLMGGAVQIRLAPGLALKAIQADAGQVEQVIMNIVMNAHDAMPNGGRLTLETANVSFDQESAARLPEFKPGDYVMLAISDTGTGMTDAVKARLFEPFFSTKGVGEGVGLGLSTCYGIVKQSGGHISVYTEWARGTTFKIYLPQISPPARLPASRLDSPHLPRGTETILLVEDDPALRVMSATLLRRLGYTVFVAANGVEALRLKRQSVVGPIDLLFTDVVMPHMGGQELASRVRASHPGVKILFTSAYTEYAIVDQAALPYGAALLQKPFTPLRPRRQNTRSPRPPRFLIPGPGSAGVSPAAVGVSPTDLCKALR